MKIFAAVCKIITHIHMFILLTYMKWTMTHEIHAWFTLKNKKLRRNRYMWYSLSVLKQHFNS